MTDKLYVFFLTVFYLCLAAVFYNILDVSLFGRYSVGECLAENKPSWDASRESFKVVDLEGEFLLIRSLQSPFTEKTVRYYSGDVFYSHEPFSALNLFQIDCNTGVKL